MKLFMFFNIGFFGMSAILYKLEGSDKWFSRLCVCIFCFGIVTIVETIENRK